MQADKLFIYLFPLVNKTMDLAKTKKKQWIWHQKKKKKNNGYRQPKKPKLHTRDKQGHNKSKSLMERSSSSRRQGQWHAMQTKETTNKHESARNEATIARKLIKS